MKHIHTFESFINEGSLSKKSGTGEIAVMRSDKAKAEKIMTDMKLDYEDLGPKDSSLMNYYKLPDTTWDILNKIGTKIDLQSMTVLEGLLNESSADVIVPKINDIDFTRIVKWMGGSMSTNDYTVKKKGADLVITTDKLSKNDIEDLMAYLKHNSYIK